MIIFREWDLFTKFMNKFIGFFVITYSENTSDNGLYIGRKLLILEMANCIVHDGLLNIYIYIYVYIYI